ncbi:hypothetical protein [Flavobacterium sp. NRK1]|uniref:hypothetical protein n=1 Tax=Flavobacterium sp. NRK1 TaxID=2954929 RepID=UPI00209393C2|nr:hypothetical protein [Flavobacterium sp. NRK1]MCO6148899.1 hypothetical protein [Flavobacterium sp. NRK1]
MDSSSLFIGLIIVLVCLLPLLFVIRSKRKNNLKINTIFNSIGTPFRPTIKELHVNKLFALDRENKIFLFANIDRGRDVHIVRLDTVGKAALEEITIGVEKKIFFVFNIPGGTDQRITIYDTSVDALHATYWHENKVMAQRWLKLLEEHIAY